MVHDEQFWSGGRNLLCYFSMYEVRALQASVVDGYVANITIEAF